MKVVQTFRPQAEGKVHAMKGGWLSAEYHWMSWALSSLQLKKYFDQVELVTTEAGAHLLANTLQLPYTNVSVILENKLTEYPPQLWSLSKIFTYSIQEEPFIHFDGDVFLWNGPHRSWQNAGIIAQNLELNLPFYRETLNDIQKHFSYVPQCFLDVLQSENILASNAGIFGGKNLSFIKRYCSEAFRFVDNNLEYLHKVKIANLNFIFEQLLMHCLLEEEKINATYVIPEVVDNPLYHQFVRFEDVPYVKMIHPVGGFKRDQFVCNHLAKRLRKEYPDYYYHIMDVCRDNDIPVQGRVYSFISLDENNSLLAQDIPAEDAFVRTHSCIGHLQFINKMPEKEFKGENKIPDFINGLTDERHKEFLSEIFSLEQQKERCHDFLLKSNNAAEKYKQAKERYEAATKLFEATDKNVWNTIVHLCDDAILMELGWKWQYTYAAEIDAIVKAQFMLERSLHQVAFVPDVIRMAVAEYYLDHLDMIIVESIKNGSTIKELAHAVAQYFEPEEIQHDPVSFNKLIIDSVRRLCYADVLRSN